eukprot:3044667-Rhodomonas_salina.4
MMTTVPAGGYRDEFLPGYPGYYDSGCQWVCIPARTVTQCGAGVCRGWRLGPGSASRRIRYAAARRPYFLVQKQGLGINSVRPCTMPQLMPQLMPRFSQEAVVVGA